MSEAMEGGHGPSGAQERTSEAKRARVSHEQQADVTRLRDIYGLGVVCNFAFMLYDAGYVWAFGGELTPLLLTRAVAAALFAMGRWLLAADRDGTHVEALRLALPLGLQVEMAVLVLFGGALEGTYGAGAIVMPATLLTCARPWRANVSIAIAMTLLVPLAMVSASLVSSDIAAQLGSPRLAFRMISESALTGLVALVSVASTHRYWQLRREHFAAKEVGRYQLRRLLGRGGMGEVWSAWHPTLRREVAVKLLSGEPDDTTRLRFEREVRATTELTHPNTIRVFDYGEGDDGTLFYTMELLTGRNLAELVASEGPLPVPRAVHLARQAASALGEAHAKGIVHRDVKPENLFVGSVGGVSDFLKVLDFGIAKGQELVDVTMTARVVGSLTTISPEAAGGQPTLPASDVYSLGASLHHALTGAYPFTGNMTALLYAHMTKEPPDVRAKRPEIPEEVAAIVARCLAKSADARFVDANALEEALARCAAHWPWTPTKDVATSSSRRAVDEGAPTMELHEPA